MKLKMKDIYKSVAEAHGVTEKEVRREIKKALKHATLPGGERPSTTKAVFAHIAGLAWLKTKK